MKRDNVLFVVFGLLVGFIAGYLLQESIASRQAPRAPAGQTAGQTPGQGAPQVGAMPGAAQVQQLRAYVQENPEDAEAVLQLANLNFDIRNFRRAGELYEQYLSLRPENPNVLSDLGICYRETGEFEKAVELFDRTQELDPDHWQSYFNEAVVLAFNLQDYQGAAEAVETLRELQPDNPDVEALATEIERLRNAA